VVALVVVVVHILLERSLQIAGQAFEHDAALHFCRITALGSPPYIANCLLDNQAILSNLG
jgi:hypothetical protein